jgi:hypothetical protein
MPSLKSLAVMFVVALAAIYAAKNVGFINRVVA